MSMAGLPSLQRCSSCLATSMIFGMAIISIHPHGHSSPDAPNQLPPRTCSTPRQTHTPPSFPLSAQLPAYLFVCVCVSVCLQKLSSSPLLLSFLPARLRISYLLHVLLGERCAFLLLSTTSVLSTTLSYFECVLWCSGSKCFLVRASEHD